MDPVSKRIKYLRETTRRINDKIRKREIEDLNYKSHGPKENFVSNNPIKGV